MKRFLLFCIVSIIGFQTCSQIDLNQESEKQKKERKVKSDSSRATAIYAIANWSYSFRSLTENEGLFSEPLGDRANETWLSTFSYGIGIQNQINKFLFWDGGISFSANGEQLVTNKTDTTITLTRSFHYLTMPLRLNAFYGNKIRFSLGAGLAPQMFVNSIEREEILNNNTDNSSESKVKVKNGLNTFVVSTVFNAAVTIPLSKNFSFWLSPEVRMQLNSSYTKTQPYIHKGRSYGLTFGFLLRL